jgi:hypothetical protein
MLYKSKSEYSIGDRGKIAIVNPILEQVLEYGDQNLQCSIDSFAPKVPEGARQYFKKHGYLIIKNLYDVKELYHSVPMERGQINYCKDSKKFHHNPEEKQAKGSLVRYYHPQYIEIHSRIRLILQYILGVELYNTYYYDCYYFTGQGLDRHADHDSCKISVSIQISSNTSRPWTFCLQTLENKEIGINIEDGWGIVYMGCNVEHWRDPLKSKYNKAAQLANTILRKQDDTYYHQIFFHYIMANGTRPHYDYDATV